MKSMKGWMSPLVGTVQPQNWPSGPLLFHIRTIKVWMMQWGGDEMSMQEIAWGNKNMKPMFSNMKISCVL